MNFNFKIIDLENIGFTLMEMRTGIYVLATIAGVHTLTLLCWFGYKYFTESKESDLLEDDEPELPMEDINEPVKQVESENSVISESQKINLEKELYHNMVMFEDKKNQLEELIEKLSKIQNNLEVVREKLTELNNSPSI